MLFQIELDFEELQPQKTDIFKSRWNVLQDIIIERIKLETKKKDTVTEGILFASSSLPLGKFFISNCNLFSTCAKITIIVIFTETRTAPLLYLLPLIIEPFQASKRKSADNTRQKPGTKITLEERRRSYMLHLMVMIPVSIKFNEISKKLTSTIISFKSFFKD